MKHARLALAAAVLAALLPAAVPAAAAVPDDVLAQYLAIHGALVKGSVDGVAAAAGRIGQLVASCAKSGAAHKECAALEQAAARLKGREIDALRSQFGPFSVAADAYLRAAKAEGWSLYYCPMVDAYWIQTQEAVENPYEPGMLRCGSKVDGVEKG
jgi:Cu(I)/Ag(I) efflux system membrane fusion protein